MSITDFITITGETAVVGPKQRKSDFAMVTLGDRALTVTIPWLAKIARSNGTAVLGWSYSDTNNKVWVQPEPGSWGDGNYVGESCTVHTVRGGLTDSRFISGAVQVSRAAANILAGAAEHALHTDTDLELTFDGDKMTVNGHTITALMHVAALSLVAA